MLKLTASLAPAIAPNAPTPSAIAFVENSITLSMLNLLLEWSLKTLSERYQPRVPVTRGPTTPPIGLPTTGIYDNT